VTNKKRRKKVGNENKTATRPSRFTTLSFDPFLPVRSYDLLDMLIDDPDAFDPDGLVPRDEDGFWKLEFDIRADLTRGAYCDVGQRVIVHDELRVWDVTRLVLQAVVWQSMFSYAAHIVRNAADILIATARTQGAWVLINTFFSAAETFGLRDALSTPMTVRLTRFRDVERVVQHAVRTVVIGHEIGHYLVHAAHHDSVPTDDLELQCDAAGLEIALLFHERYVYPTLEDGEDGPEPVVDEGIGDAWRMFEHLVTALFAGDALLRRTAKSVSGEYDDAFPLARRRTETMITNFRSSETGRRELPLRDLSLVPLHAAFAEVDAFVARTIDLTDDRFSTQRLPSEGDAMAGDSRVLEKYWIDRLFSLGLVRSLGGTIIPQAADHPGMDRWLRVIQACTRAGDRRPRSLPMISYNN
jgi:hypothetical protein